MQTKRLILMALLVAIGAVLYLIIPGYGEGMKPDFMLTMMFIGIFLFPDVKNVFLLAVSTGILSGLFTTFPGGLFPNIIDKFITAFVIYFVILAVKGLSRNLLVTTCIAGLGTMLSGSIFLTLAIYVLGVKVPFGLLFVTVVLPTVAMSSVVFFIFYPIMLKLLKRTSIQTKALANS